MKNYILATFITTLFVIVYATLPGFGADIGIMYLLFMLGMVLMGWMIYTTLCFAEYTGTELKEGEEFGYEDVDKNSLWIF